MALFRTVCFEEDSNRSTITTYLFNNKRVINWKNESGGTDFYYKGVTDSGSLRKLHYDTTLPKTQFEIMVGEADVNTYFDIPITGSTDVDYPESTTYGIRTDEIIFGYDIDSSNSYIWVDTGDSRSALRLKSSYTIQEIDDAAGHAVYYYYAGGAIGSTLL
jgi:hypothetical protein